MTGEGNHNTGKSFSEETKKKMSKSIREAKGGVSDEIIIKVRDLISQNYKNIDIQKELDLPRHTVTRIKNGDLVCRNEEKKENTKMTQEEINISKRKITVDEIFIVIEKFNKGYITSDSLEHDFCIKLINKYNLIPVTLNPSDTIAYSKNFNKLILSEGGFSWAIGFLSKANEIICNSRELFWHGDIYFDKWKKLKWDYSPEVIYDKFRLKEYKPIKLS
jgi:hypothetical protein